MTLGAWSDGISPKPHYSIIHAFVKHMGGLKKDAVDQNTSLEMNMLCKSRNQTQSSNSHSKAGSQPLQGHSEADFTAAEKVSPSDGLDASSKEVCPNEDGILAELWSLVLLTTLYAMQGVPLGLTMGAMPFLLQANATYTAIGIFSFAAYPYSFKLAWSPIVDSCYNLRLGRRKSWIVPIQLVSAALLLLSADWADAQLQAARVGSITALFCLLVMLAATQDIAVDGWALTLLSPRHVGWASTCQTVGMNLGYFSSFTVFLALNDASFCNKYLRQAGSSLPVGLLTLSMYLKFWGWMFAAITLLVAVFKRETNFRKLTGDSDVPEQEATLKEAYAQLWQVISLKPVQRLAMMLLTFRLAMLPAEAAAPLKLLEKGVPKEALAALVLLEFPCEMISAVLAGRWASGSMPFTPWLRGFWLRLICAAGVTAVVARFPTGASRLDTHPWEFAALATLGLATSFASTLMFTAMGSFFNRISDPAMGGSYLTLLNTIANMGVTLPKFAIFAVMDLLSQRECIGADTKMGPMVCPANNQAAKAPSNPCLIAGGTCQLVHDGYYQLSYTAIAVGVGLGLWYSYLLPQLSALPTLRWRAKRHVKLT